MFCSHHVPHATFSQLAEWGGGGTQSIYLRISSSWGSCVPGSRYLALLVLAWVLSHCHTQLARAPRQRSPFAGFLMSEHWGKKGNSPMSLSEPWPWNAFPGSSKAISQLGPPVGKSGQLHVWLGEVPLSPLQQFSPGEASDHPEPLAGFQAEEFRSAEGDREAGASPGKGSLWQERRSAVCRQHYNQESPESRAWAGPLLRGSSAPAALPRGPPWPCLLSWSAVSVLQADPKILPLQIFQLHVVLTDNGQTSLLGTCRKIWVKLLVCLLRSSIK